MKLQVIDSLKLLQLNEMATVTVQVIDSLKLLQFSVTVQVIDS